MGAFTDTFGIDGVAQSNLPIKPPTFLRDGNTVAWYDASDLSTISKNGGNTVSRINDKFGSGHDLVIGSCSWSNTEGFMFDGVTDYMKTNPFTYDQPEEIYLLIKQVSWKNNARIFDGDQGNTGCIFQAGLLHAEGLDVYAGETPSLSSDKHPNMGPWNVMRVYFNGDNSNYYINGEEITNVHAGSSSMGGITLGDFGGGYNKSHINIRHAIFRKIKDSPLNRDLLIDYLTRIANALNNLNERVTLKTNFINKRFGVLFHWNMASFTNEEQASPNLDPNTFNPSGLDIDSWLDAVVSSGAKYAFLTAKHTDGFALWDTAYAVAGYDPYSVNYTTWYANNHIDILDEFTRKCRERNLKVGLYFSVYDGTYQARRGSAGSVNDADYLAMVKSQLSEILTRYGHIDYIWLDAWGKVSTWLDFNIVPYTPIDTHIKSIDSNTLIIVNMQDKPVINGDIKTYENSFPPRVNYEFAEKVFAITLGETWFYATTLAQTQASYYTSTQLKNNINLCNGRNSNFLLGLIPNRAGVLSAIQTQILAEINL